MVAETGESIVAGCGSRLFVDDRMKSEVRSGKSVGRAWVCVFTYAANGWGGKGGWREECVSDG
jgi:hypothetical protein